MGIFSSAFRGYWVKKSRVGGDLGVLALRYFGCYGHFLCGRGVLGRVGALYILESGHLGYYGYGHFLALYFGFWGYFVSI